MSESLYTRALAEHQQTVARLHVLEADVLNLASQLARTLRAGGKLMFCGNGGSAADSQHLAAELTGRFLRDRHPLAAIALSTDSSALTCIGNDYGFDHVFERQVRALGKPADTLICISTSGRSKNLLLAAEAARQCQLHVAGLLGRDGGGLAPLCNSKIVVQDDSTARIQEAHIFIGHCLCELIEQEMGLSIAADVMR